MTIMKNKIFALFISVFILSVGVNAQTKDAKAVTTAVESLRKALIDGNTTELENLASEKLSYGHSGGAVEGKAEFVEKIASGKSDFVTIELSEQTISVSGKTAVVRHTLNGTTNDGGKPATIKLKILLVWQKENGMYDIVGVITLLLVIWAIIGILQSGAEPVTKLIWVLIVLVLPLVGFVLWFLIGPGAKTLPGRRRI